jgi:hypothetical protein
MERLGYIQSTADDSICTVDSPESRPNSIPDERIIVAIYVDDILVLCKRSSQFDTLAKQLGTAFPICEMSPIQRFLGMDIIPHYTFPTAIRPNAFSPNSTCNPATTLVCGNHCRQTTSSTRDRGTNRESKFATHTLLKSSPFRVNDSFDLSYAFGSSCLSASAVRIGRGCGF